MGSITFEMLTRNLNETIENLDYLEKDGFTDFLANLFYDVHEIIKEIALEIIESGEPQNEIPLNVGGYALKKMSGLPLFSYDRGIWITGYRPVSHGLGRLTGDLYMGVANQPIGEVTITRGKEVAVHTTFREPSYIGDVHDGKPGIPPRPFMDVATRRVEMVLTEAVEEYLKSVNITSPPPSFIASLIVRNVFRDINVY
jgi:hypothetical protein